MAKTGPSPGVEPWHQFKHSYLVRVLPLSRLRSYYDVEMAAPPSTTPQTSTGMALTLMLMFVSALQFHDLIACVCLYTIVLWHEDTYRGLITRAYRVLWISD